jgi:hypothetical protein
MPLGARARSQSCSSRERTVRLLRGVVLLPTGDGFGYRGFGRRSCHSRVIELSAADARDRAPLTVREPPLLGRGNAARSRALTATSEQQPHRPRPRRRDFHPRADRHRLDTKTGSTTAEMPPRCQTPRDGDAHSERSVSGLVWKGKRFGVALDEPTRADSPAFAAARVAVASSRLAGLHFEPVDQRTRTFRDHRARPP